MNNIIYIDNCFDNDAINYMNNLNYDVIIRNNKPNAINNSIYNITNVNTKLIVFNLLDAISYMELGLALFMCKRVLITDREFNKLKNVWNELDDLIEIEYGANLLYKNNTFIDWFNTYGKKDIYK